MTCLATGGDTLMRSTIVISSSDEGCDMVIFIMKRSRCASGSWYTPSDSIGFCVAITKNGVGTSYVL